MSEKEQVRTQQSNNDIMSLIWKYARTTTLGNIIAGFAIVILVLQLSGLSIGSLVDKRFWLKSVEQEQAYTLQIKMIDIMEAKILPKIDNIQVDINAMKVDIASLKSTTSNLDNRVLSLEKKYEKLDQENAIVHTLWRKNNQ